MDCTEVVKETCKRFGISGYPMAKIFKSSPGSLSSDYDGPSEKGKFFCYVLFFPYSENLYLFRKFIYFILILRLKCIVFKKNKATTRLANNGGYGSNVIKILQATLLWVCARTSRR